MRHPLLALESTVDHVESSETENDIDARLDDARTLLQRLGINDLLPDFCARTDDAADLKRALIRILNADPARLLIERRSKTVRWWVEELFARGEDVPGACRLQDGSRAIVHERLGVGGFGSVWDAESDCFGRIALKFALRHSAQDIAIEQMEREAQMLREIQIPGVPRLHGTGQRGARPFVAMEFIHGPSLRGLHQSLAHHGLSPALVETWRDIARILSDLHCQGIGHGDIKPDNILIGSRWMDDEPPRAWLIDFGLATNETCGRAPSLLTAGTRGYIDPHAFREGHSDALSDIFALGATMFEGYAGEPFRTAEEWDVQSRIENGRLTSRQRHAFSAVPSRSSALERLLHVMLGPPANRPEAGEIVEEMEKLL